MMAATAISRRKLICNAPALGVAAMVLPALGGELATGDVPEWRDRVCAAAVEFRQAGNVDARLRLVTKLVKIIFEEVPA